MLYSILYYDLIDRILKPTYDVVLTKLANMNKFQNRTNMNLHLNTIMARVDAQTAFQSAATQQADPGAEVRSWGFDHVFTWTDGPYVILTYHQYSCISTYF